MARYQGIVRIANQASPRLHRSLRQHADGPPNHQDARPATAIKAGPTGPLVRKARAIAVQNPSVAIGESRRLSRQRDDWATTRKNASVASVVASFDSITMIGEVASASAARRPATGPSMARPSHQVSTDVDAPATAEASRRPNGLSPPIAVPRPISQ